MADCKDCPVGDTCTERKQLTRNTFAGEPGCCFGAWTEHTGCGSPDSKCSVKEICEIITEADDGNIAIVVETPGYSCFAKSPLGWDAVHDSECAICDLYEQCKETYIDKPGIIAVLEEA